MLGCDTVVHLAAAVGVRYILANPLEAIKTNVDGTDIILRLAAPSRRKVLVASTSEVCGKNSSGPLCETADSILGPARSSAGRTQRPRSWMSFWLSLMPRLINCL
jgi:nucleoside-diphosphate-sugar epimerase